mgnify:CR=1 FL=1
MADTSKRKTRRQSQGTTQIERNRRSASIPQGNEVAGNIYNVIKGYSGLGIDFQNTENFNQSDADYTNSAYTVYNEAEPLLKNLEGRLANSTYTVTFNSNTYTFTATSATISQLVTSVAPEQEYQDKTVALSPTSLFDGFHTTFIAPATNTGSATVSIQLYDTTFASKTLKKYENGVLVNLTAGDIAEKTLYHITIISGEAVLFNVPATIAEIELQQDKTKFITPYGLANANLPLLYSESAINTNTTLSRIHANKALILIAGCTQITLPPITPALKNGDLLILSNASGSDITLNLNSNTSDYVATKIFNGQKLILAFNGVSVYRIISSNIPIQTTSTSGTGGFIESNNIVYNPNGSVANITKTGFLYTALTEGSATLNFASAFPTSCFNVQIIGINDVANINKNMFPQLVSAPTTTGFTFYIQDTGSTQPLSGISYIAFGK